MLTVVGKIKASQNSVNSTILALTNSTTEVSNVAKQSISNSNITIKLCSTDGCNTRLAARGLCYAHYYRLKIAGGFIPRKRPATPCHQRNSYGSWSAMIQRCYNFNNNRYHRYGGRGIFVCDEWRSFEGFYADMGDRPEGKTLDRIDNDGNYTPENCRWATQEEQDSNKCINHFLTFENKTLTLSQWSREKGIHLATLAYRVRSGWDTDAALHRPPMYERKKRN